MAKETTGTDKKTFRSRGGNRQRGEDLSSFVFGKVQPQATPLEEAVLGAIMLSKEALPVVLDILKPSSFYLDGHQRIFEAMLRLFERSQPIDLLTVMEELKKSGDLESVGGPAYLAKLTESVASAANIEYHGRIIAQKYIQRELIQVSTKIIKDSFEDTTDVFQLLDDAEQGLFSIAQQNMGRNVDTMSSLASRVIKQLEELKNSDNEGLTGVPTGFTDLDRLTSGLQRSDLIILAARPGMGKTALTLSLAKNAAVDFGKGVAIFSLEMSSLQLAQRVITIEAEVQGSKMRNGQLADDEWERLHHAIERIGEAPIFIDDTPGINAFELRAKCRRLKMQYDIQLIIVDYLQLMTGGGENAKGNREQEVSAISRALKGLAKELNVPVIALSQLSRAVETRGGSKRPMLSDLRESGCLTGDTLLQHAETGAFLPIGELADRYNGRPIPVLAMGDDQKIGKHTLTNAFSTGTKPVFELITRSGHTIKATANHKFYTVEGWKQLDELAEGQYIAVPRSLPTPVTESELTDDELILLAHLIGDGCILPKQPHYYTSADPNNITVVEKTARKLFEIRPRRVRQETWEKVYLPSPYHLTNGRIHPITEWYERIGLKEVRSFAKRVPTAVFQCSDKQIALFLRHLWATHGSISWKKPKNRKPGASIFFATNSPLLAQQVKLLLLRLGIISTVARVRQGRYRDNYHVKVQGKQMQTAFLNQVGSYGRRGAKVKEVAKAVAASEESTQWDMLPATVWTSVIKPAMRKQNLTQRQLLDKMGVKGSKSYFSGNVARTKLAQISQHLEAPTLTRLVDADIRWDQIKSLTPLGDEKVYDATVDGVHNFVANGIVVHNSIEQDADMVAFIYRPEYYDILEDEEGQSLKGVAELIIAKNRHGAQETVKLRWTGEFARFSDMDDMNFNEIPGDTFEAPYGQIITRPSKMNDDEDIPF